MEEFLPEVEFFCSALGGASSGSPGVLTIPALENGAVEVVGERVLEHPEVVADRIDDVLDRLLVALDRHEALPLEVRARRHRQLARVDVAQPLPVLVHAPEQERDPAAVALEERHAQPGMPLEDAACAKGAGGQHLLDRMGIDVLQHRVGAELLADGDVVDLIERYGIFGGVNCLHLSDSPESGSAEVARWAEFVQLDEVSVELGVETAKPNHTYHLRSLATQVAGGVHVELASQMIRDLLDDESDIEGDELEALCRITLGALA